MMLYKIVRRPKKDQPFTALGGLPSPTGTYKIVVVCRSFFRFCRRREGRRASREGGRGGGRGVAAGS